MTPAPTHPCSAVDSHSTFGLNARARISWMTLSRTKPPKLAPARPLSGWGFSFPATGITLAAGTVGTAGSTRHCTGALARASEPAAPGLPFHAAVTSRHDNVDGGLLGRSASKRRRRILPLTARRRRRFSCCPKVLKRGRAVLRALKLPLTAARLPSQPGRWDGVRPLCQAFAFWPPSPLRLVLTMEGVECLMK